MALAGTDGTAAAERLAHTLKGLAGTLGAHALQALALRLEQSIASHATPSQLETALDAFGAGLATVVAGIESQLPAAAPLPAGSAADPLPASVALAELERRLRESDPAARDFFQAHLATLRTCIGARCEDVAGALDGFDFDAALALLEPAVHSAVESETSGT